MATLIDPENERAKTPPTHVPALTPTKAPPPGAGAATVLDASLQGTQKNEQLGNTEAPSVTGQGRQGH